MLKSYVGMAGIKTAGLSFAGLKFKARALYEVGGVFASDLVAAIDALGKDERRARALRNGPSLGAHGRSSFSRSLADKYARQQAAIQKAVDK